ncbi:MAG: corrinoid activation/regeneration protein AcsV [Eubacteriaceae bacterium]|nr:corrinoid activation/regeneration protein AcsV [Eubacteriaceae bacterium]
MHKITYIFEGQDTGPVVIEANDDENLLSIARKANVAIDAPCSGNGSCGKCKVKILSGSATGLKTRHIDDESYAEGMRLACSSYPASDITVLVPDIARAYKSRMKIADLSSKSEVEIFNNTWREVLSAGLSFENGYRIAELSLSEPTFDDTMPDNERLMRAVNAHFGTSQAIISYHTLKKLPIALRSDGFRAKAVVKLENAVAHVLDIFPASEKVRAYCAVIDIGTTTVSAIVSNVMTGRIYAKASSGNGQIRYGADVINRIIESSKAGGQKRLMDAVIEETINPLLVSMCQSAGISAESIYEIDIAGNTTMQHLFTGVYADYLRQEPFVTAFFKDANIKAGDLGLYANAAAEVLLAPNVGSYVGGDITAGTLASMIWDKEEFSLFLDLGTNGELVFGNRDFLLTCACSAGPAFEGGEISCGMRATDGAIEKVAIPDPNGAPELSVIGGGKPVGICGSGIIDLIAEMFRRNIMSPKGRLHDGHSRVERDSYGIGRYILASSSESAEGKEISINEVDIDNFIRAKGAIFSAIRVMLNSVDMDMSYVSNVYVAGGIGSGINMRNAIRIGLFPDIDLANYHYIGNSSLSGTYCMAHSNESRDKIFDIAENMTYIELSNISSYMQEFVAACFLPHTDESLFPSVFG